MRIKEVSCRQFAGIRDRRIGLEPGINVVYGANESGKSTMVNLISRTLFQNVKLDNRDAKGKAFRARFFPGARRGKSTVGDTIDGEIVLDANGETYTLSKEWGEAPGCALSSPDGLVQNSDAVSALLKEVLCYGEGVYTELLLSPRSDMGKALETILNNATKSDAKAEILDALSQAFAESGGISVDAIGEEIGKRIDALAGKHWDESRNVPERNPRGGRWSRDVGSVMTAYYALADAEEQRDALVKKEDSATQAAEEYRQLDTCYLRAVEELEAFQRVYDRLILREAENKQIAALQENLKKLNADLRDWPEAETALKRGRELQGEECQRKDLDQYRAVTAILAKLDEIDASILERPCPDDEEIRRVRSALRNITALENKLCGMNLTADLKLFGDHQAEIRSIRTGELLRPKDGKVSLTEAVTITVPGVMNMVLAPADVDVSEIEKEIRRLSDANAEIFARYGVDSSEALQEYADEYQKTRNHVDDVHRRAKEKLAGRELEELKAQIVETVRTKAEIDEDVAALCGETMLDVFVLRQKDKLKALKSEYESISALEAKRNKLEAQIAQLQSRDAEEIPEEYAAISSPEAHLQKLKTAKKELQDLREDALTKKTRAESEWNTALDALTEDPQQQVREAARRFDEEKELLCHWRHIRTVFEAEKERVQGNPTATLAESFARYLDMISEGSLCGELPEQGKLDLAVYSKDRLMDFSKLSEGTKDTVSLAYRLAVLDQLFPDGGGIIVLDDAFSDMDVQRTARSIELVKECAKRHQVIFLTCKEDIAQQLEGNLIRL